jgi:hypothetical protein
VTSAAREVIRKVRDEILTGPDRWAQGPSLGKLGTTLDDPRPKCLGYAIDLTRASLEVREEAGAILVGAAPYYPANVISWNDAKGRTFADVRALLDKALEETGD